MFELVMTSFYPLQLPSVFLDHPDDVTTFHSVPSLDRLGTITPELYLVKNKDNSGVVLFFMDICDFLKGEQNAPTVQI